jgi:acyl-CoA ligase (AMP-forming) (exosortase A-associated)
MTVRVVHDLVIEAGRLWPDRPALTVRDTTLSYQQLAERMAATAALLDDLGVRRGDRVAIYLDKRVETVLSVLGASAIGAVFVPVNPLLKPRQAAYIMADCGVRTLVTTADRWAALVEEVGESSMLHHVVLVDHHPEGEQSAVGPLLTSWAEPPTPFPIAPNGCTDADVAAIFYTSGSTGMPKGVVLSHRNIVVGAQSVSDYLQNSSEDVILAALPLSFDAGFSQLTTAFATGAHVVLVNYLLPRDVVRLCAQHRVTGLTAVPPLWVQLTSVDWPPEATASLRYFANTGGRMPKATLDRLRAIFPLARPYLMYGLTEAFRSTYLDPDEVDRRPDSIGKAIPNAEILVVRPDGSVCDVDEAGELVHLGPLVSLGYWNDLERTAERFKPAPGQLPGLPHPRLAVWSGDYVTSDRDGFLYFVGRHDEMIKTSGYRVSPSEIEEAAFETGLVKDVVALGVPDAELGQRVVLVVAWKADTAADAEGLVSALRAVLPRFMVPHRVHVLDDLPRSPNGKYDRTALREEVLR